MRSTILKPPLRAADHGTSMSGAGLALVGTAGRVEAPLNL